MTKARVVYRVHAIQRMFERQITEADVRHVLDTGVAIEDYPDDTPYSSQLILGWREDRPLHIVVATSGAENEQIIVTVYEPDPVQWEADFMRRKP